jgi:hypothetical protein
MDAAVEWCLDNIDTVENYLALCPEDKMEFLTKAR